MKKPPPLKKISTLSMLVCLAFAGGCAGTPAESGDTFTSGVMLPFSGTRGEFAEQIKRGMEIAREEIDADKTQSKKLKIVYADTKDSSTETSSILNSFVDKDIKLIHAGFTRDIAYDMPTFGLLKDSLVNYLCTYPPAAVMGQNGVRIFLNGAQESEIMAKLIVAPKGEKRKLMIMGVNDPAGKSCSEYIKFQTDTPELDIMQDSFRAGEKNFNIFAEQICLNKTNYVLMYGFGDNGKHASESLAKAGFAGLFASNCGFYPADTKSTDAMQVYEVQHAFARGLVKNDSNKKFVNAYEKKYGQTPHWAAAYGYDSVMLTWRALEAANFDASRAKAQLVNKSFEGAAGKISIDSSGDSTSELELVRK